MNQQGGVYSWEDCDPRVRDEVPPPHVAAFQALLERTLNKGDEDSRRRALAASLGFPDGSRKLGLNKYLCKHGAHCASLDDLLDVARSWNEDLPDRGLPSLSDSVVASIAGVIWDDVKRDKVTHWQQAGAIARITADEFLAINALARNGADAVNLLMFLRTQHGARCARGESFAITPKEMEEAECIPFWTRYRYEHARDLLLEGGFLVCIRAHNQRTRKSAQYRLVDRK